MRGIPLIRYHGTPLTPVETMLRAFKGKNAMVSYYNPEQIEEACEVCQSVVLDCGTFPAWMAGTVPDFDGYLEWATHWVRHPAVDWCVIPDIIDGNEEDNDEKIAAWPLPKAVSVPVYHLHERLERLERLLEEFPRVGLGSSGEYADPNTEAWWGRMFQVMEVACDAEGYPKKKLHGFRMLDTGIFARVPLSSADSTNVARNIGLDIRWRGTYVPRRKLTRAIVLMHNIEDHVAATRWNGDGAGFQQNMELLG